MVDPVFNAALERVLDRVVPDFVALENVVRLSGGASQETHAVDIQTHDGSRRLALRRAPGGMYGFNDHGRPGLAVEARLMQLAAAAGVPEPTVLHVLTRDDALGDGFLMDWLEGETLGQRIVRDEAFAAIRPQLASQCGGILARIHAIDIEAHGLDQVLETLPPEAFVRRQWEHYQSLNTPQPMIDYTARWLLDNLPRPSRLTLVHNDFRNGNLMITPTTGVTAVLDWEVAHIGDPMRDLGWICTNSWRFGNSAMTVGGFGALDDLIRGYEAVSGTPVDRGTVHFWQVFGSYWWAIGCLTMAEHYRSGPDRSVERPAIGRRSSECQVDCVNLLIPGPVNPPTESAPLLPQSDLPYTEEIVGSVRDFLRGDVAGTASGRHRFLARVAANALDIALREMASGPAQASAERSRLETLLGSCGTVDELRRQLSARLQAGEFALDDDGLTSHLRETVIARCAIDQPGYSGLQTALERGMTRERAPS